MTYAILRTEKLKKSNIAGSSSHVTRSKETKNADPERLHLNRTLIGSGMTPKEAITRRVNEVASARKAAGGRKLRSDAVLAVEHILTASPEYWAGKTQADAEEWAKHSVKFLVDRFGSANVVSATLHMDEKSPHLHVYHVPATTDPQGRPTLSAKQYYGTPELLSEIQTDYAVHVQTQAPELQRGVKKSKATHQEVQRFYSEVNRAPRIKVPRLDDVKVEAPPVLITAAARNEWAEATNRKVGAKVAGKLKTLLKRLKVALKAARHYKALYLAERDRTAAYRHLVEDPKQIKEWQDTAVFATDISQRAGNRVKELEREGQAMREQLEPSAANERGLKALCDAIGIKPEDAERKAPAVEKTLQRYRASQRETPRLH